MAAFTYTGGLTAVFSIASPRTFTISGGQPAFGYEGALTADFSTGVSDIDAAFKYTGGLTAAFSIESTFKGAFLYTGGLTADFELSLATATWNTLFPYRWSPTVMIDDDNVSGNIFGQVRIIKKANAAGIFEFNLNTSSNPSSFLDSVVKIGYNAADGDGIVSTNETLLVGKIRNAAFLVDAGVVRLQGYDYGGIHNSLGEAHSGDLGTSLTGTVDITGQGTFSTGHAPIWNVRYEGTAIPDVEGEGVTDGKDFLVDSLNGDIYIPLSSKFVQTPDFLTFDYAVLFEDVLALMQAVASVKGWSVSLDGVTLVDYDDTTEQPIVTMSNESIIDQLKKMFEIAGAKLDTSLFPTLRVYSEYENDQGGTVRDFGTTSVYETTLAIEATHDNLINEQTVNSVITTFSNVTIGDSEDNNSDSREFQGNGEGGFFSIFSEKVVFRDQAGFITDNSDDVYERSRAVFSSAAPREVARVPIQGEAWTSGFTQSGTFRYFINLQHTIGLVRDESKKRNTPLAPQGFVTNVLHNHLLVVEMPIADSDWVAYTDLENNESGFRLLAPPIWHEFWEISSIFEGVWQIISYEVFYPDSLYAIQLTTTNINYGEGVTTDQVSATGTRTIPGISDTLVGDVIEHPYVRKVEHAEALGRAVLFTRGNKWRARWQSPIHKALNLKIGQKATYSDATRSVTGVMDGLQYDLDTSSGSARVVVSLSGEGTDV